MKTVPLLVAFSVAAGAAAAQESKQPPAEPRAATAKPAPRLNLSIDDIDSSRGRMRFGPEEKEGALPSLGADARPIDKSAPASSVRTSPYPPDTNPGR
jgi:hypothetical protein